MVWTYMILGNWELHYAVPVIPTSSHSIKPFIKNVEI